MFTEYTCHRIRNDIGSWGLYIWSRHGRSLPIDKDLRQAQYVTGPSGLIYTDTQSLHLERLLSSFSPSYTPSKLGIPHMALQMRSHIKDHPPPSDPIRSHRTNHIEQKSTTVIIILCIGSLARLNVRVDDQLVLS